MSIAIPDDFKLNHVKSLPSTNDALKTMVKEGKAFHNTVVWADEQTNGRGRKDRQWISQKGNLFASILLDMDGLVRDFPQLSFVAAVALRESLLPFVKSEVNIGFKWPNDILLNDKKIAGILLETVSQTPPHDHKLIIGVGVNVKHHPEDVAFAADSIAPYASGALALDDILASFLWHFKEQYIRYQSKGFASIIKSWLAHAGHIGQPITVTLMHEKLHGVFLGLDDSGALRLELADGKERIINAGDVYFG